MRRPQSACPPNAAVYTDWAEAVAQAQGETLPASRPNCSTRRWPLDPTFPEGAGPCRLRGARAQRQRDRGGALWKRLRATLPPDSPNLAEVDEALARVGVAPPPKGAATAAAAPAPSPAPAMAAKGPPPSTAAAGVAVSSIEGRVEVDPKLAGKVAPGDTVFILARDPDGSQMPLAALKLTGADLPKSFALSDAMAMSRGDDHFQGEAHRRRGARQQVGQRDAAAGRPLRHQRTRGAGHARRPRDDRSRRPVTSS